MDDPNDPEAAKQRPVARKVMAESAALFVPLTVVLELEWVLRAFYGFDSADYVRVIEHLLGLENVTVEEPQRIRSALQLHQQGLDFADALHWTACNECTVFLSFDDRRFAKRAKRLAMTPK